VLSPAASYDNAREFVRRRCWKAESLAVYAWGGKFWEWNGRIYEAMPEAELKSAVYRFLDESVKIEGKDLQKVRFRPKQSHVHDLLDGLRAGIALPGWCDPPMRLDTGERAGEILAFKNGLVEVTSGSSLPATPKLWIHSEVPYEWQPGAKCPEWLAFLGSIFPGDQEAQDCVEEFLGLTMTEDLAFQKGALLVGEPRSGKGTILKVGEALVGARAYVSLELDKWTMGENSGERLIGRKMLAFPDVRLKPPRWYGANFDPGGVDHKSVELLLKITGGDRVSLGRKYIGAWEGSLPGKVWIVSNKVPNFNDAVLPTRFVKLAFDRSFLGREDIYLADRLLAHELPGIAARCLRAYWRLRDRKHFVQPRSAARLEREIAQSSDAFTQFVLETFIADPDASVTVSRAFSELEIWCGKNGRQDILRGITRMNLAGRIRAVGGFEQIDTFKPHGKQRRYKFMRLRREDDEEGLGRGF
jgi:putative DNA primase/helicase